MKVQAPYNRPAYETDPQVIEFDVTQIKVYSAYKNDPDTEVELLSKNEYCLYMYITPKDLLEYIAAHYPSIYMYLISTTHVSDVSSSIHKKFCALAQIFKGSGMVASAHDVYTANLDALTVGVIRISGTSEEMLTFYKAIINKRPSSTTL